MDIPTKGVMTMTRAKPNGTGRNYKPSERRELMAIFLKAYGKTGNFTYSCTKAGVAPITVRRWLDKHEAYADKFREMQDKFVDGLEMIAVERAKEKSDSLMALLLRANRPEKYRDNIKMDADVKGKQTVNLVFSKDEWGNMPNYATGEGVNGHGGDSEEEED